MPWRRKAVDQFSRGGYERVIAEEMFQSQIAHYDRGRALTLLDHPAPVMPPGEASLHGEVEMIVDGTDLSIWGDGKLPVDELVEVMRSIDLSAPIPPR